MMEIKNPYTGASCGAIQETPLEKIEGVLVAAHRARYKIDGQGRARILRTFAERLAAHMDADTPEKYLTAKPAVSTGAKLRVITEPLDLVVGITPFNHPMNQVAHKVFPAIAAGASIVLKPSEKTPLSALLLQKLLMEAGLPKHLLTIVINKNIPETVRSLVTNPLVDLVSFTGSRDIGIHISQTMANGGNALKRFLPELGGSAPFIFHSD